MERSEAEVISGKMRAVYARVRQGKLALAVA
jgi:hypothetical protein